MHSTDGSLVEPVNGPMRGLRFTPRDAFGVRVPNPQGDWIDGQVTLFICVIDRDLGTEEVSERLRQLGARFATDCEARAFARATDPETRASPIFACGSRLSLGGSEYVGLVLPQGPGGVLWLALLPEMMGARWTAGTAFLAVRMRPRSANDVLA